MSPICQQYHFTWSFNRLTVPKTIGAAAVFVAVASRGQSGSGFSIPPGQEPLTPSEMPGAGNYYFLVDPSPGIASPPLPCPPPPEYGWPVYALGGDDFLIDNSAGAPVLPMAVARGRFGPMDDPLPQGGGGGSASQPCGGLIEQGFSLIDTNDAAENDTNLYNALLTFPADTNIGPDLQIMRYVNNSILIKANHFDYSSDSRDFALVVCDSVALPVWKTVNLSNTTNVQDGWLVQGIVPNWEVMDPMYMMVSNITSGCDAFFQAVPYSGPKIVLTGADPYDTVSNTIMLQAEITDLSGTADQYFALQVSGLPVNCALGANNSISFDTHYFQNGYQDVALIVGNTNALLYDPTSSATDVKLDYETTGDVPLVFQNEYYIVSNGDMASPDIETNYFVYGIGDAEFVQATVYDPSNGNVVMTYTNYYPYGGTVTIPWNFTEADGVTPYSSTWLLLASATQEKHPLLTRLTAHG
jgi:hypothetical protein